MLGDPRLRPRKRRAAPRSEERARGCHFKLNGERAGGRARGSARQAPGSVPGLRRSSLPPPRPAEPPARAALLRGGRRATLQGWRCGRPPGLAPVRARCERPAGNPEPGAGAHAGARTEVSPHPAAPSAGRADARRAPFPRRGPPGSAHSACLHTCAALAHARPAQLTPGALPRPSHSTYCASHRIAPRTPAPRVHTRGSPGHLHASRAPALHARPSHSQSAP